MENEPDLEISALSQPITHSGHTVSVEIYRLEGEPAWMLEVVDEFNNSTVWDDPFDTEAAALAEVKETIAAEGIAALVGAPS